MTEQNFLRDIDGVCKAGELGGFIEKEENLSQVFDKAWVSGEAQVSDKAWVFGEAQVSGEARVSCGCFSGSLLDFEKKVKETHKNNPQYLNEYLGAIEYVRRIMK